MVNISSISFGYRKYSISINAREYFIVIVITFIMWLISQSISFGYRKHSISINAREYFIVIAITFIMWLISQAFVSDIGSTPYQ